MATISRQMRRHANNERRLKMSLEQDLIPRLQKLFDKFMRDFRIQFKKTATVLNAHSISSELNKLLAIAYKRTAAAFTENFTIFNSKLSAHLQELKQGRSPEDEETDADNNRKIEAAILAFILATVPVQTRFILNTTNEQLACTIRKTVDEANQAGEAVNVSQIADRAFTSYSETLSSRIGLIATFETQNSAEEAKSQVAQQLNISAAGTTARIPVIPPAVATKVWVAVLDNKTRTAHALADGQQRNADEPFNVMNQQLMRPGDTSLGATPANVMECRCSAIYS